MGVCILKNCKVIKLAEEVYSDLIIRQAAEDLFNNLDESCEKIIMDFVIYERLKEAENKKRID